MSDLISRQKTINTAENMYGVCDTRDITDYKDLVIEALEVLPSAERTGKWISDWNRKIKMIDGCPDGSCHCSNCGEWLVASDEYAVKGIYCPNCGARMVSEDAE